MELYSSPSIIRMIKMIGGTCSTHGREEKCMQGLRWESQKEENHWEDLHIGGG
jgi:hypothetical protein